MSARPGHVEDCRCEGITVPDAFHVIYDDPDEPNVLVHDAATGRQLYLDIWAEMYIDALAGNEVWSR